MSMLRSVIKSLIAKVLFVTDLALNRQTSKDLRSESAVEEDQAKKKIQLTSLKKVSM